MKLQVLEPAVALPRVVALTVLLCQTVSGQIRMADTPSLRLGAFESPPEQVFGQVRDVVITSDGSLIVLDFLSKDIRLFDSDGVLLVRTGRAGRGPGEFDWPQSLELLTPDSLLVFDVGNRRLSVYEITPEELRLSRSITLPAIFRDLCVMEGRIILTGNWQGHAVHEFDRDGQHVRSFGPLPSPGSRDPADAARIGRLASGSSVCVEPRRTVVIQPLIIPETVIVTLTDGALHRIPIPDYRATQIVATSRGTIQFAPDPESETAHEAVGLATLTEGAVLVQVQEMSWGSPVREPESWILNLQSFELVRWSGDLPPIVRAAENSFISTGDDPFPYLAVWPTRY